MQEDVRSAVPRTDHQEEDALTFRRQSPRSRCTDEQSRIAPQKPNRRSPRAGFSDGRGFRRHLLSRYSVRAEVRDGEARGLLRCGFSILGAVVKREKGLTEDCGYMAAMVREKGSGES